MNSTSAQAAQGVTQVESGRKSVVRSCLFLTILAVLLAGRAFWYDFLSDDALIVARYARNIVRGHGWVYNVGERVEGYTSFVWVAVAARLAKFGVDYVRAVQSMSLASALLTLPLLLACAKPLEIKSQTGVRWIAPLLFACCSTVAVWAWGGLEATGYAFLTLLTLYLLTAGQLTVRRAAAAGVVAGLCGLTRPEGAAVAAVISFWLGVDAARGKWRVIGAYALPAIVLIGAHLLWRKQYYGYWLPNTAYAKVGSGSSVWAQGFLYLRGCLQEKGGMLAWLLPIAAPWFTYRNAFARGLSLTATAMMCGIVLVGGDGLPMHRFLMPIVPLWLLLFARLLGVMVEWGRSAMTAARTATRGTAIVAVLIVAFSLATNTDSSDHYIRYWYQQLREIPDWTAVGQWLNKVSSDGDSVACAPIGAIGYYSNLTVYDMMGLTDTHIAHKDMPLGTGWAGHEKHDGPYILSRKPTYLLLGNVQVLDKPLATNSPYFVRPPNDAIRARESDIFTQELAENYTPRVAPLENGKFLHLLQRRPGK